MSDHGRRLAELRRSGAAGYHDDRVERGTAERAAVSEQVADDAWACPRCACPFPPRETPAGTFCVHCREKITTCCEGAPL